MADEIKKLSGRLKEHGTEFNELKDPDSDAGVAGEAGEVGDQGGLAHAGVALQEDRVVAEGDDPAEVAEVPAHLLGEDVALLGEGLLGAPGDPEALHLHALPGAGRLLDGLLEEPRRLLHPQDVLPDQLEDDRVAAPVELREEGEAEALQQAAPHAPAGVPRRHFERPAEGAQ